MDLVAGAAIREVGREGGLPPKGTGQSIRPPVEPRDLGLGGGHSSPPAAAQPGSRS